MLSSIAIEQKIQNIASSTRDENFRLAKNIRSASGDFVASGTIYKIVGEDKIEKIVAYLSSKNIFD